MNRISIFVDMDNFQINYRESKGCNPPWKLLNQYLLKQLKEYGIESCEHKGTWLCVGVDERTADNFKNFLHQLDCLPGYIVRYGMRDRGGEREKGVDSEIVCSMLEGAFYDLYDSCILLSDDADYIPVVHRVQDRHGKRVFHASVKDSRSRMRAACYAHIAVDKIGD